MDYFGGGGGEQRLCWPPFNIRIYAIESSVFTHIRSLAFDTSQIDLKHAAQRERQRENFIHEFTLSFVSILMA